MIPQGEDNESLARVPAPQGLEPGSGPEAALEPRLELEAPLSTAMRLMALRAARGPPTAQTWKMPDQALCLRHEPARDEARTPKTSPKGHQTRSSSGTALRSPSQNGRRATGIGPPDASLAP